MTPDVVEKYDQTLPYADYVRREVMVPMRDGVKLFTVVVMKKHCCHAGVRPAILRFSCLTNSSPLWNLTRTIESQNCRPDPFSSFSFATFVSCSLMAGWINQDGKPSEEKIVNVLSDQSVNAAAGYVGGVAFSANQSGSTTQLGGMTPQAGGSWGYTAKGPKVGLNW
jgi:predicted acyl esterase